MIDSTRTPDTQAVNRLVASIIRYPLLPILAILIVVFAATTDGTLLSWINVRGVLMDAAIIAIVAVPGAMLIIAGYIDLSVGSTFALGGVLAALVAQEAGSSSVMAVLAGVVGGVVVGLINGVLASLAGLSPFIVTLGTLTAVRGVAQLISPLPVSGFGDGFTWIGIGTVLGIPIAVWLGAMACLVGAFFLARTPPGRHVYAIGVNREAARLSGVGFRRIPLVLYVISGAAAALAGTITVARLNSAPAGQLGLGFEMSVLAAILLGGVALKGGDGSMLGVVLGVLLLGVLSNGLILLGVQSFWQSVASGVALVLAIAIAEITPKMKRRVANLTPRKHRASSPLGV